MKRLIIDLTPYQPDNPTGAGRLVHQLVEHLFALDRKNRYTLFGFAPAIWPADQLPENYRYLPIRPWRFLGPLALESARRVFVGGQVSRYQVDLVHCTLEMVPLYDEHTRVLFSLYDLARLSPHFLYSTPQNLRSLIRTRLRYRLARQADLIHTISEYSAEQIAHQLRIDRRRIRVVYPGVDPRFTPGEPRAEILARHELSAGGYFLFVGQFGRQKNEDGLIKAFLLARRENALPAGMRLALVGDVNHLRDSTNQLLHGEGAEAIRLIGGVDDEQLLDLYRGAVALTLPSFYEGFGLPALEAMGCGVPPIVSGATSLPEVVGEAGLIVTAGRHDELAEAMSRLARDGATRARLAAKSLERAQRFSYANMAQQMLNLYREMTDG